MRQGFAVVILGLRFLLSETLHSSDSNRFTGFFPCVPGSVNMSTQEDAQSCDLFVYAAVQLALDRVEEELESERRKVELSTVVTERVSGAETDELEITEVLFNIYKEINQRMGKTLPDTRAFIGTDDNYVTGAPAASIARSIGIPIVSYGLHDNRMNKYTNFFRTIPSTDTLNDARITLLQRFGWIRIGILGSSQKIYHYQMESFREYFRAYSRQHFQFELSYVGTVNDLQISLQELHRLDIRIIVGFFGPEEMRAVLCEASASKYNLVTSDHVWILPSYYNPNWWIRDEATLKYNRKQTKNCTTKEMRSILNSVIFLDPVKYPPLDTPLMTFYSELLNKIRQLFSQLQTEVNLESLLQHSRAVSAYDSTLLLARSLTDGPVDWDRFYFQIVCELCRINLLSHQNYTFCKAILSECRNISNSTFYDTFRIMSSEIAKQNTYGQVLISQFINGTHCPIAFFWPSDNFSRANPSSGTVEHYFSVYSIANVTGLSELNAEFMFPNAAVCPKDFYWKGRESPPSSNAQLISNIPEWALAVVGVVIGISEVLVIFLLFLNIIFQKNSHMKVVSPRVNIIMLVGTLLRLPYSLVDGIILSGTKYNLQNPFGTVLCQFNLWLPTIGITLIETGYLVKIYRLYKIFRNKSLRKKLNHLHDRDLLIGAILLLTPVLAILIVLNAIPDSFVRYLDQYFVLNGNLQSVQITTCGAKDFYLMKIFIDLIDIYIIVVFITTLVLSMLVSGAPKSIRMDLTVIGLTAVVGFSTAVITGLADDIVQNPLDYELRWWLETFDYVFGILIIMSIFIVYQVSLVYKSYYSRRTKKQNAIGTCSKSLDQDSYHKSLLEEVRKLSSSLSVKEAEIKQLKMQELSRNQTTNK